MITYRVNHFFSEFIAFYGTKNNPRYRAQNCILPRLFIELMNGGLLLKPTDIIDMTNNGKLTKQCIN